jgi:hypothetical protein
VNKLIAEKPTLQGFVSIRTEDGTPVCVVPPTHDNIEAEEIANRIVTACNSHDALIDACREAKTLIGNATEIINDGTSNAGQYEISRVYAILFRAMTIADAD